MIINYEPKVFDSPKVITDMPSAWTGLERILSDIINRFELDRNGVAIEFGVEYGFSTSAFAHYFNSVIGIDTFQGDIHTFDNYDHYEETKNRLKVYPNIKLFKTLYQDWITRDDNTYEIAHVDIVHTYEDTYDCGEWCVNHSKVTLFHDTESFHSVKAACNMLSEKYNLDFYNYEKSYGLGILVNHNIK